MDLRRVGRRLRPVLVAAVVVAIAIQLVPHGRAHDNPPVSETPPWPSPRAALIADQSCAACHSNTTDWPWYSHVAPMSWLVTRDVVEGRDELNLSTWADDAGEADDAVDAILDGSMPPLRYVLMHPRARLTAEERELLVDAFRTLDDAD